MDTVLVTGISGFLGGHVALTLLKAGYRVRGSVRNLSKSDAVIKTLKKHGADTSHLEFVALDLLSDSGWQEAVKDTRYVQHVASPFVLTMPDDRMELIKPAVEGTERAITAALNAGVERIVLTSSFAAIGYGHTHDRNKPFTEADWTRLEGGSPFNAYIESKTRAEQRAWEMMEKAGRTQDLAVINPVAIFGPILDNDPGTSGTLVLRTMNGSLPAVPDIQFHGVDVRDVAELHARAMSDPGAGGHRFLAGTTGPSMIEIARLLAAEFPDRKNKFPRFQLPGWLVRLYALFDRDLRGNLGELGVRKKLDSSAATALLGQPLKSPKEAIIAMAHSLIEQKLV